MKLRTIKQPNILIALYLELSTIVRRSIFTLLCCSLDCKFFKNIHSFETKDSPEKSSLSIGFLNMTHFSK